MTPCTSGLLDLAGLEAGGADVEALRAAVDDRPHALHVGVPAPLRAAVRVAHPHPEPGVLPAHLAYRRHDQTSAGKRPAETSTGPSDRSRARRAHPISAPSRVRRAIASAPMSLPLERLAASDLKDVVFVYRDALRNHQEELNRLNVYPVPDGDTGTNRLESAEQ